MASKEIFGEESSTSDSSEESSSEEEAQQQQQQVVQASCHLKGGIVTVVCFIWSFFIFLCRVRAKSSLPQATVEVNT